MKVEKLKLKDFLGNDIYIMQAVVFADSEYGNGYYLKNGYVVGETENFIKIMSKDGFGKDVVRKKASDKVVKVYENRGL